MSVKDARTAPFIWASIAALEHLRENWSEDAGARPAVGRSVYYALCELANEDRAREQVNESSGRFRTSRKRIVEQAGVSDKPVDKAIRELERIGLLVVERTESTGTRPGASSAYMLLEPGQTCGASPHVEEAGQRAEKVRTSSGVGPDVEGKGAEKVRTAPYRVKKTAKKQEVCSNTATVAALPQSVEVPLRQAAEAKEAVLDPQAVRRACETYADRDHAGEAEKFAAWHLHGNGRNAPLNQVALAFRNWLKRSSAKKGGSLAGFPGTRSSSPVVESKAATRAWDEAKKLLKSKLPESSFAIWFAPLEAAGEREGRLVLLDTTGNGGWVERRYRPLILEAMDAFDEIEIVDETQLEMEEAA